MPIPKLPVIFIFDLDQTLIGNRAPYFTSQTIKTLVAKACLSNKINMPKCHISKNKHYDPKDVMRDPFILRPYLKESLLEIKKMFDGCAEFFIFTAGANNPSIDFIEIMEKMLDNIKFNRPILTYEHLSKQDDGVSIEKSMVLNIPECIHSLIDRYPSLKDEKNIKHVMDNRFIFMDDVNWVDKFSKDHFIQNKPYPYHPLFDMTEDIPICIKKLPIVNNILKNVDAVVFTEPNTNSLDERNMLYHIFMADLYRIHTKDNNEALKDTFFKELVVELKKIEKLKKPFAPKVIENIRHNLVEKGVAIATS